MKDASVKEIDRPLSRVNVYFEDAGLYEQLCAMADERRWSRSATIAFIVEQWFEKEAVA